MHEGKKKVIFSDCITLFEVITLFIMYVAKFLVQIRPNIQDHNYSKTLLNYTATVQKRWAEIGGVYLKVFLVMENNSTCQLKQGNCYKQQGFMLFTAIYPLQNNSKIQIYADEVETSIFDL